MMSPLFRMSLIALSLVVTTSAFPLALDWQGQYRFEVTTLSNPRLDDSKSGVNYALSYLALRPVVIASDGIEIQAQFDVMPNSVGLAGSQHGQVFGENNATSNKVFTENQGSTNLNVTQMFLHAQHEYGALIVGRAPLHFGLGLSYSNGFGIYDHWGTTRDLVGYKFVVGNLFFMPMLTRYSRSPYNENQQIGSFVFQLEYDNADTGSAIGLMYEESKAGFDANDINAEFVGGTGATVEGGFSVKHFNFYLKREFSPVDIHFEAGFLDGNTGVQTSASEEVKVNGYGMVFDVRFKPAGWSWGFDLGYASGDNPETDVYEGFAFHKNYDVGFLMYNHPMGQYNLLGSNKASTDASQAYDEESVSNTAFVSFDFSVPFSGGSWTWDSKIIYGQLSVSPIAGEEIGTALGTEFDTGVTYRPHENVTWRSEIGYFQPGEAFEGGSNGYSTKENVGFRTQVGITF